MDNEPKVPRAALRIETLAAAMETELPSLASIVDVLATQAAKGNAHPELWDSLHEAAMRDGRVDELSAIYAGLSQEKRIKLAPPAVQRDVWLAVATFFEEYGSDVASAESALERAFAADPGHLGVFERLDRLIDHRGDPFATASLCVAAAPHRAEVVDQVALLRRAIDLLASYGQDDDKLIKLCQAVLKLDPNDDAAGLVLEERLAATGRTAELAKLFEQRIASTSSQSEAESLRNRLLPIYANELRDHERAVVHFEALLRADPTNEMAYSVADELLGARTVAARVAAALTEAYRERGWYDRAAEVLVVQVDQLRGGKRLEAQKQLAVIRQDYLADEEGAFDVLEQIVTLDAGDDDSRRRYRRLASSLGRGAEAARLIGRAVTAAREPALKAKLGVELGMIALEADDRPRAVAIFATALETGGDDEAVLAAAVALEGMADEFVDGELRVTVLEAIGALAANPDERLAATARLARVAEERLHDFARASVAYGALLGTALEVDGLHGLARVSEALGHTDELATALERLVKVTTDPLEAKRFAFRATEARTSSRSADEAIAAWRAFLSVHGEDASGLLALASSLERAERWQELEQTLTSLVSVSEGAARADVLGRVAALRAERTNDPSGALDACRDLATLQPQEPNCRRVLEILFAADGPWRTEAASMLASVIRGSGDVRALVSVLDRQASFEASLPLRVALLRDSAEGLADALGERDAAMQRIEAALAAALAGAPDLVEACLDSLDRLVDAGADPQLRSACLARAVRDREIDSVETFALARRAGAVLEADGDAEAAIEVLRRALAFAPGSLDLVDALDRLLASTGAHAERARIHGEALEHVSAPDRSRLLSRLAALQRHDLNDPRAASQSFRRLVRDDSSNEAAFAGLLEALEAAGLEAELAEEIDRGLASATGALRRSLLGRRAALATAVGDANAASEAFRALVDDDQADEASLRSVEAHSRATDDAVLAAAALARLAPMTQNSVESSALYARLADALVASGRASAAPAALRRAAESLERSGENSGIRALYERIAAADPADAVIARKLLVLYALEGAWAELGVAGERFAASGQATDIGETCLELLGHLRGDAALRAFEQVSRAALGRGDLAEAIRLKFMRSLVELLATSEGRTEDAAAAFRAWIEAHSNDASEAFDRFDLFLAGHTARTEDRRWLFERKVLATDGSEQAELLFAWAAFEESVSDLAMARSVLERLVALDPANVRAHASRTRILLRMGEVDSALESLSARREHAELNARRAVDLEIAALLVGQASKTEELLRTLVALIDEGPIDDQVLRVARLALEGDASTRVDVAHILARALDRAESAEIRGAILTSLLSVRSDAGDLIDLRRAWFDALIDVHAGAPDEQVDVALRAACEFPEDGRLWDRAETLGRSAGRAASIAAAYRLVLESPPASLTSADAIEALGQRAVEFHEEWFDEAEAVLLLLRRTHALAPSSVWTFDRLKLAYAAGERWGELLDLYDATLAVTDDLAVRAEILEDGAQIARDFAADNDRAIRYLEDLYRLRSGDARLRASLERLYERYGRHRELVVLLEAQLPDLSPELAVRSRLRLAAIWIDGLCDAASAMDCVDLVLASDPERSEAFDLLERVMASEPPSPASKRGTSVSTRPPAPRARAAEQLEARYRRTGSTKDLVRVLGVLLESVGGKKARVKALREIIGLRVDGLSDHLGAMGDVAQLLALDPSSAAVRRELVSLAESAARFDRAAEILEQVGDSVKPEVGRELLVMAAELYDARLADAGRAIALYRRAVELTGSDPQASLGALRSLERLLGSTGQVEARCGVLESLGEIEDEPSARRAALAEASRIAALELGDPARAIRAHRRRVALDPSDRDALDGLVRDLESTKNFSELTQALSSRAELSEPVAARADRVAVARILAERMGAVDQAIETWVSLRADLGTDEESTDALGALLASSGRYDELLELLRAEAVSAPSGQRRAHCARRAGEVHVRLDRLDAAVECFATSLSHDVAERESRGELERLVHSLDSALTPTALNLAVAALDRAYLALGETAPRVALLEPRLAVAADDVARAGILLETSALLESTGAGSEAFDAVLRALELDAASESVVEPVVRLATATSGWSRVAEVLTALLDSNRAPASVARTLLWHVGLFERDVRIDEHAAERAFDRALGYAPDDVPLLEALVGLRRKRPDRRLVDTLLALARNQGDDPSLHREAALVAAEQVGDRALALSIAERLFEVGAHRWSVDGPSSASISRASETGLISWDSAQAELLLFDPGEASSVVTFALALLVKTARESGDRDHVARLLARGATLPFGGSDRRALRLLAADLAAPDAALMMYEELFSEDPTDEVCSARFEAALRRAGKMRELVSLRARQVGVAASVDTRVALRYDAAVILRDLGDASSAIEELRRAMDESPLHAPSFELLARLLEDASRLDALVELWETQASRRGEVGDAVLSAAHWKRAAELAERFGDSGRAIRAYRRAADGGATDALDSLSRVHSDRGELALAADALEALVPHVSASSLPEIALRLAALYETLGDAERARTHLERAREHSPNQSDIRERLVELYRAIGAWQPLAELIAASADDAPDLAGRVARLREAAELHLVRRSDPSSAVPLLERLVALAPDDTSSRLTLASALTATSRFDDAHVVVTALLDAYGARKPKERALVHHAAARIATARGDAARGLLELELASKIDPSNPELLYALAKLALDAGELDRAERVFRALLLIVRRAPREGRAAGPTRGEVFLELSRIAARQGNQERASDLVESAFEEAGDGEAELVGLTRALRDIGDYAGVARALERRLSAAKGEVEVSLLDESATVFEERLGRVADARTMRLRALALSPESIELHRKALATCSLSGAPEAYVDAVAKLVERADDPRLAAELWLMLGQAQEESPTPVLSKVRAAYERAEELAASASVDVRLRLQIWRKLETLHAQMGDAESEARVLERRLDSLRDDVRAEPELVEVLYRLAALTWNDGDRGHAFLEDAVQTDGDRSRADAELRRALERGPRSRVARILEAFARHVSDSARWVESIEILTEDASDAADLAKLEEASQICRDAGESARAEALLRRLIDGLEREGDSRFDDLIARALVALAEDRRRAGDLGGVAALEVRAAERLPSDEARRLLLDAATIASESLGDLSRAAGIYETLRSQSPAERDIWQPLLAIRRSLGQADALAALLAEVATEVDSAKERAELRLERAKLLIPTEHELATSALYAVLDDDPGHREATELLVRLLEERGTPEALADFLTRQLEAACARGDDASSTALAVRIGGLREAAGDMVGATVAYTKAIEIAADDLGALRALVRLAQAGHGDSPTDALARLLAVQKGPDAEATALELARLRAESADAVGELRALRDGLGAHPESTALRSLLVQRLTEAGAWHELAEILAADAAARVSEAERLPLFRAAAELLRDRAGDAAGALAILVDAVRHVPLDRGFVGELVAASEAAGDVARSLAVLDAALEKSPEDAWLLRSRATAHRTLGRPDRALLDLQSARRFDASDELAHELAAALDAAAASGGFEGRTARDLRLDLSKLLVSMGQADLARAHAAYLVSMDAADHESRRQLAAIDLAVGRFDEATASLTHLASEADATSLGPIALDLLAACRGAGRLVEARSAVERASLADPSAPDVRAALRGLYEELGETRALGELLVEDARKIEDVTARIAAFVDASRLFCARFEDASRAIEILLEADALRPSAPEIRVPLAGAYGAAGYRAEATAMLEDMIAAQKGRRSKAFVAVYLELATIEQAYGDLPRAVAALQKAYENDPQSSTIATRLGSVAFSMGDRETATRAFRSVTLMKPQSAALPEGASGPQKSIAYYHLAYMAEEQGDRRKARTMIEKATSEDPTNNEARAFFDAIRG